MNFFKHNITGKNKFRKRCFLSLIVLMVGLISQSSLIFQDAQTVRADETTDHKKEEPSLKDSSSNQKEQSDKMPSDSIVFPNKGKSISNEVTKTEKKPDLDKEKMEDSDPMSLEEAQKLDGRIPGKITRYAQTVIKKHDTNKNGQLDHDEWSQLASSPEKADINQDNVISLDEIKYRIANYGRSIRIRLRLVSENVVTIPPAEGEETDRLAEETSDDVDKKPAPVKRRRDTKFYPAKSRIPANLPATFIDRDRDGDAQLTIKEFAKNPTKIQIRQFQQLDINHDGLVTAKEFLKRTPKKKKTEKDSESKSLPE